MRILYTLILGLWATTGWSAPNTAVFPSIDGGTIDLQAFSGQPVLVVNTASQCAFTRQYAGLQALYDRYRYRGLVVIAVPSDDFNQELETAAEVKDFCEINYDLDLPMTDLTHVRGSKAHAFFQDVKAQTGFVPRWNFSKVLIGPEGDILGTWGSAARPDSGAIPRAVEAALE